MLSSYFFQKTWLQTIVLHHYDD